MKIRRLSTRLAIWLVPATAAILLGATLYQFKEALDLVVQQRQRESELLRRLADAEIHRLLDPAGAAAQIIASQIPRASLEEERIHEFIVEFLDENPGIFGSTIALEPDAIAIGSPRTAPYYHRKGEGEAYRFVDLTNNHYLDDEWYAAARDGKNARWSKPYFDRGGGEAWMVTYSAPFDRMIAGEEVFGGVITADVKLDRLSNLLAEALESRPGLELTIVTDSGRVIAHSHGEMAPEEGFEIKIRSQCRQGLLSYPLPAGEERLCYDSPYLGSEVMALPRKLDVQGWTLILGVDRAVAFAKARKTRNEIILATAAGLAAMIAIILLVTRRVSRPVALLARTTRTIAEIDLDVELPEPDGHDEIAGLQRDFIVMRDRLRQNIARREAAVAAREKLETDLSTARKIQMGLLPALRSLGSIRGFEIATSLTPAKAVGGDLYNYFYLDDEDRSVFCFAVGDVSDKGIPAALFMARTSTLVRPATRYFRTPDAMLSWLARELTRENAECMFVTLLYCAIEVETGAVTLANAAHLDPLIVHADGAVELRPVAPGPPLGVMPNASYPTSSITLQIGDSIVLFSDGVTEAMNEAGEQYGEERLLELARSFHGKSPAEMTKAIVDSVHSHAGAAPQSDDITVLVLRRTANGGSDA